jgi:hypothetical protein
MTGWTDDAHEVECPMPGCTEPLTFTLDGGLMLSPELLAADTALGADDFEMQTWKVECLAGHVVLLPDEAGGCSCDDFEHPAPDADHDDHWYEGVDDSDRHFHGRDMARLRALIGRLR